MDRFHRALAHLTTPSGLGKIKLEPGGWRDLEGDRRLFSHLKARQYKPVPLAMFALLHSCCLASSKRFMVCPLSHCSDTLRNRGMARKKAKGPSFTGYIRIITNVITFGLSAATTGTVSLATSAAKATADLAVQPFNTLIKATKETYFAPQVTYPDRSWSGMVESLSARKRAWTGESAQPQRPRSGSVATFHHLSGGHLNCKLSTAYLRMLC